MAKTAPSGVVHFYGQWKDKATFTVKYHLNDETEESEQDTTVVYGTETKTLTISELGYSVDGMAFAGWKAYREVDGKWHLKNVAGTESWETLIDGALPEGSSFCIYGDGCFVSDTAPSGNVHFYAQWRDNTFTVNYHLNDTAEASEQKTVVNYGTPTDTLTVSELGYSIDGMAFTGWKAYREIDDAWYIVDSEGVESWVTLENGELPEGSSYYIYRDGHSVSKTAPSGNVHFYAQWRDNTFTVNYHLNDTAEASEQKTVVNNGMPTDTLTVSELGYSVDRMAFTGWKAYREIDNAWYVVDSEGVASWITLENGELPAGSSFYIYGDGCSVSKTATSGNVHFYAQWRENFFTVKYHLNDEAEASVQTTTIDYDTLTATLTVSELGFKAEGMVFTGWKVYREYDKKWYMEDNTGAEFWGELENGELPEGCNFYLRKDGCTLSKTSPTGVVHLYGQWTGSTLNVSDYGADGTDEESDYASIQRCLNFGKNTDEHLTVNVGPGTYYIDATLTVYSNTDLVLDDNAEIIRMDQSLQMLRGEVDLETGGYGQSHNITIKGGKWNGNITSQDEPSYGLMTFNHAQGITLEDFEIKEFSARHMVAFDGVKDVVVRNVTFKDQIAYTGEDNGAEVYTYHIEYNDDDTHNPDNSFKNMEALHFDFISEDGVSAETALPLDGTMCENILVENCTFDNLFSGVGSHYYDESGLRNNTIVVRNNTFTNVKYTAIHVCQYENAEVYENTATNVGELLRINKSSGSVHDNTATIKNSLIGSAEATRFYGIFVYSDSNLSSVEDNTISGTIDNGISIVDSAVGSLKSNTITNVGKYGLWINNSSVEEVFLNSIDGTVKDIVHLENSEVDTIQENTFKNGLQRGIVVERSTTAITGNVIENISEDGIRVDLNGVTTAIDGNTIINAGKYGIVVDNTDAGLISGNSINTTGNHGILIINGAADIDGNELSNVTGQGINVTKSECTKISNNTISNVTKNGIYTGAATVTEINGNIISDIGLDDYTKFDGININIYNDVVCTVQEMRNNSVTGACRKKYGIYQGSTVVINENNI